MTSHNPPPEIDILSNIPVDQGGVPNWFSGSGSQARMFEEADKLGHQFFVARNYRYKNDDWGCGYEYTSFPCAHTWKDTCFRKNDVHYEIIRTHTQLYIDVDHNPSIATSDVIKAIDRKLQIKLAGFGIPAGTPYVTRASSSRKGSAHMHYNVRFETGYGLKTFMRTFVDDIKAGEDEDSLLLKAAGTQGECVPDLAVYSKNRLLRLPWQTKKGVRPLIPDDSNADVLHGVASHLREVPVVPWDPPATLPKRMDPKSSGPPDNCLTAQVRNRSDALERELKLPSGFLSGAHVKPLGSAWLLCSSHGGNECACKGAITSTPHNPFLVCTPKRIRLKCHGELCRHKWRTQDTPVLLRRLLFHDRHLKLDDAMRLKPQPIKNSVEKPYMEEDKIIIGQHMPAIDFGTSNVIVPKSRDRCAYKVISGKKDIGTDATMSSGKTYSVLELVGSHPEWTVLFVSCRIAYTKALTKDCKKRKIDVCCYQGASNHELNTAKRVIIQFDSLSRLMRRIQGKAFDLVVLDEITELTAHPDSRFLRHKAYELVPLLKSVTMRARHVIAACADWGLSARGALFLAECKRNPLFLHSETASDYRHYIEINPEPMTPEFAKKEGRYKREHLGAVLKALLDADKRVAVVSNTKSFINDWAVPLAGSRPKRVYTSDTGFESDDLTDLTGIHMLAYSPTVGPGVSFDEPFDALVLFMQISKHAAGCRYTMQMIQRVRKLTSAAVFFCIDGAPQSREWLNESDVRLEQIALDGRVEHLEIFVDDDGCIHRRDTLWAKLQRSTEAEKRQDAAYFEHRFVTRTEDRGGEFWILDGVVPIPKPGTETASDMNRLVADMQFDENWDEIDTKSKMTLEDCVRVQRGHLSRWLDDDASPDDVYAFLEQYVPKSKLPYIALLKKKERFDFLCGKPPRRDNQRYIDITSDMKILLELLDALGLQLLDFTPRDERMLKSGEALQNLQRVFKQDDKILRESLSAAKKSPRQGYPQEVTTAMKLLPKLLRSCGLCSGLCGDERHFIRKKDTTVEGERVKYRVYGVSQPNLHQMIELDVLEHRRNIEEMVELKNAWNREGEETKSRNTDHQRFRALNEETIRQEALNRLQRYARCHSAHCHETDDERVLKRRRLLAKPVVE